MELKRIGIIAAVGILSSFLAGSLGAAETPNKLIIHADQGRNIISRNIYGQFSEHLGRCIYEGIWVGEDNQRPPNPAAHGAELLQSYSDGNGAGIKHIPNTRGIRNDVVAALKKLKIGTLRWPGGCFADEYHWKDGIGPREKRPAMINTHWGGVVENNNFGTHEFLDFCEQIGASRTFVATWAAAPFRR